MKVLKPDMTAELREQDRAAAALAVNPLVAHCPTCDHEWVALFLPMNLTRAAEIMKRAACPKGCAAGPRLGSVA